MRYYEDPVAFNTAVAKEIKRHKKSAGIKSIRQNYRGTGSQKFRRQLWVRFENGKVIDVWLDGGALRFGGVLPTYSVPLVYAECTPEYIAKCAAKMLADFGGAA